MPHEDGKVLQKTLSDKNKTHGINKRSLMVSVKFYTIFSIIFKQRLSRLNKCVQMYTIVFCQGGRPVLQEKSTLALDGEILQVLEAVDLSKAVIDEACSVNRQNKEEPSSAASEFPRPGTLTVLSKKERDTVQMRNGACLQHTDRLRGDQLLGDTKRPGRRSDCKDLAQKLLFSEDSGNVDQEDNRSKPSSRVSILSRQETRDSQKAGSSNQ